MPKLSPGRREYNNLCRVASAWLRGGKRPGHVAVAQKRVRPPPLPPSTHPPTRVSCQDRDVLFLISKPHSRHTASYQTYPFQLLVHSLAGKNIVSGYVTYFALVILWGWSVAAPVSSSAAASAAADQIDSRKSLCFCLILD